jgi:hypothetical protein
MNSKNILRFCFLIIFAILQACSCQFMIDDGYEREMNAANELKNNNHNNKNEEKPNDIESLRRLLYKYLSDVDSMSSFDVDEDGHDKRDYGSSNDDEVNEDMRISNNELANIDMFLTNALSHKTNKKVRQNVHKSLCLEKKCNFLFIYLKTQVVERFRAMPINEYVNLQNEKQMRTIEESSGTRKKRSCGKYNGNNTFRVIVKKSNLINFN